MRRSISQNILIEFYCKLSRPIINLQQQIHSGTSIRHRLMQVEVYNVQDNIPSGSLSPKNIRSPRSKSQTPPKVPYKGITLKQYFRLCEENTVTHQIDQLDGESQCSEEQTAQTPTFGIKENCHLPNRERNKIKTEVDELDQLEPLQKLKQKSISNSLAGQKLSHQIQLKPLAQVNLQYSNKSTEQGPAPRKPINSLPNRNLKQLMNRSTLSSFYNMQKKRKKMLNKIKNQKERINQMKLSDAFCITKYASKFRIDDRLVK